MNSKYDFLRKDVVDTYYWSSASKDRTGSIEYVENGRTYSKYGTFQAVTYTGIVYKVYDNESKMYKYVMCIGMAKQHPCDVKIDKKVAFEVAYENALMDPICTLVSPDGKFSKGDFLDHVSLLLGKTKLEFVKTKEEMKLEGKDPKKYNR